LNSTEDVLAVFGKIMPKKFDDVSARVRYICLTGSCLFVRTKYTVEVGKILCPKHSRQVASIGDATHSRAG
jgi:hypothetical protein